MIIIYFTGYKIISIFLNFFKFVFKTFDRGDYLELAEVSLMRLGGPVVEFKTPGGISNARYTNVLNT